ALAVSPNGAALFATAYLYSDNLSSTGMATVAFDAATGTILWSATVPSAEGRNVAVSPDGSRVFVTGSTSGKNPDSTPFRHALTISYDTTTGQQIWSSAYSGNSGDQTLGFRAAAKPDGTLLYVAGSKSLPGQLPYDVALLVYDPQTGQLLHEGHHPANT